MMLTDAKPYIVPDPASIVLGPWQMLVGDAWTEMPGMFEGWDAGTDVHLRRQVEVHGLLLRMDSPSAEQQSLVISTSWTSSSSMMSARAGHAVLPQDGTLIVQAQLPGELIGGTLDIRTTVSVAADWDAPPGEAHLAGSVLVEDKARLALEGTSSMFPVSVIDFTRTPFDPDASWHLSTTTDLEAPFMGQFLLSINARDTELVSAVSSATRTARQSALVEELRHQVAQILLELAQDLDADGRIREREWPADSVGDTLARTLTVSGPSTFFDLGDPGELSGRRSFLMGTTRRNGQGRAFL
jgi:hypothetical protein